MKRHLFSAVVILSLILSAVMCLGFFGNLSIDFIKHPTPTSVAWVVTFQLDRGRFAIYREEAYPGSPGTAIGFQIIPRARFLPLRPPDLRRSTFDFDAHHLPSPTPGTSRYLIACPIWCVCALLFIAPTIWLVKWRGRRIRERANVEGFAVVQS